MFHYFSRYEKARQEAFSERRDRFLQPLLRLLTMCGVRADAVTFLSVVLLACGVLVIRERPILGGAGILVYCLLDGVDGPLSRYQGNASEKGSLLDIFADQIGVVILPAFSMIYFQAEPVSAYLFGLFYVVYILLVVVLNRLGRALAFVLRVKYVYYVVFFLTAYLKYDFLTWFHKIFGAFYLAGSIYCYFRLLALYRNGGGRNGR